MREIAQKYGIRLKTLYKKNNIKEGVKPMIGQRLNLK
jgi:LysM repeat protein